MEKGTAEMPPPPLPSSSSSSSISSSFEASGTDAAIVSSAVSSLLSPARLPTSLPSPGAGLFYVAFGDDDDTGLRNIFESPVSKTPSAGSNDWNSISLSSTFENLKASSPTTSPDLASNVDDGVSREAPTATVSTGMMPNFSLKAPPTKAMRKQRKAKRHPKLNALPAATGDAFFADNGEVSPWTASANWSANVGPTPKFSDVK